MAAPESSLSLIILNLIRHIASSPLLNCLGVGRSKPYQQEVVGLAIPVDGILRILG